MRRPHRDTPVQAAFVLALTLATALAPARASFAGGADPEVRFATGRASGPIPFELAGNHIYVRARVNDSRSLWFLLDTGATASYLDTERALALGLERHGAVTD